MVTSTEFDTASPMSVFDPSGDDIGTLTFTASMPSFNLATLTNDQIVAYLTEIEDVNLIGNDYKFTNNYLVIKPEHLENYLEKHFDTAPLWGRFSHLNYTGGIYKSSVSEIHIKEISYPSTGNTSALLRQAVAQPFSAERFLKLYHVLETDFDYVMVTKLRDLDLSLDSHKMGELINSFSRNEYDRLLYLIENNIADLPALVASLDRVMMYQSKAETIFYTFGKTTNPLKDLNNFNAICSAGGFNQTNVGANSPYRRLPEYTNFVFKITAYWIYRVRCCIAHNKVGEYIFQPGDEAFIVEFAEPLLRTVLTQYLK